MPKCIFTPPDVTMSCRASILTAEQAEDIVAQYKSGLFWKIRQQELDRVQAEDVVLTEARAALKVKKHWLEHSFWKTSPSYYILCFISLQRYELQLASDTIDRSHSKYCYNYYRMSTNYMTVYMYVLHAVYHARLVYTVTALYAFRQRLKTAGELAEKADAERRGC